MQGRFFRYSLGMKLIATIRQTFSASTPIGTATTFGIFEKIDEKGFAFFRNANGGVNWAGSNTFKTIQIL